MEYNIIFKYIGNNDEDRRNFDLYNINQNLNFHELKEFIKNKEYIKDQGKLYTNNMVYTICDEYMGILSDEILCIFGVTLMSRTEEWYPVAGKNHGNVF